MTIKYKNPIISGFHPDPSIIRVEEDYYLITSSFEYFPGVPIFHSKDLVNWKQIGHVLTRKSQVDLGTRKSSEGIFAPTLRYHEGTFYMITTDVYGIGNFYVTAKDPTGPWSDPIKIPYGNIDPSLMFDEDGKVYVTAQNGEADNSHVIQYEIDIKTGQALTEPVAVFWGDGGEWTEGPHLYKINGMYYILSACGGTGYEHRAIIARSSAPYGPYELYDQPILTHNQLPEHPIHNLGHADFVEDLNGNWWAVFLGVRPVNGEYSVLGRETFLAPITWTEDDWPTIDNNEGSVGLIVETDLLGTEQTQVPSFYDDFTLENLVPSWSFLRQEDKTAYSLTDRYSWLKLLGNEKNLTDLGATLFVSRRQQHVKMELSTFMEFVPHQGGEEAGLAVRYNEKAHIEIGVKMINDERFIVVSETVNGQTNELGRKIVKADVVKLAVRSDEENYYFLYADENEEWKLLGEALAASLSPEKNGGFTGVCIGLYATGNGEMCKTPAFFDWVRYEALS
ncbi:glycoside hydrolase family 43 protein [Anaerobacillus sp. CMMVII]|uniref:glycoside hydrolase family 43 protein n=1 Tax=Anaerobacillus sp. CMMVII TaxID=2755588 RepID=UPI0021B81055|nr:glycoside hydrolase family 43 protein [Anaerobacillus sp. CMMVII]MCT8137095.1 glycoside hydrolase family 43 protein [Anaerobacillus sp. CMMVII]